jgi:hypothetical protein
MPYKKNWMLMELKRKAAVGTSMCIRHLRARSEVMYSGIDVPSKEVLLTYVMYLKVTIFSQIDILYNIRNSRHVIIRQIYSSNLYSDTIGSCDNRAVIHWCEFCDCSDPSQNFKEFIQFFVGTLVQRPTSVPILWNKYGHPLDRFIQLQKKGR